jgi:hypothetical protein
MPLNVRSPGQKADLLANVGEREIRLLFAQGENAWQEIQQKSNPRNTDDWVIFIHNNEGVSISMSLVGNEVYYPI